MPLPDGRPTYRELAEAANVAPGQVKRDKARGATVGTIAEYLAWRSVNVQEYQTQRRRNSTPSTPASGLGINTETARLRRAQADREELEVAERRGELVPAEDVRQVALLASNVFASQLEALPGRLANELAAINDPALILAKLKSECHRIREATAAQLAELAERAAGGDESDGEAAADAHAGRVGESDARAPGGLGGAGSVPQ